MARGKGNIPNSVWLDPKTGKEPKTPKEFEAQQERIEKWLVQRAAEEAAKKFERGDN